MNDWHSPDLEIKVGVSACLRGEEVRYDGGHKRDAFVFDTRLRLIDLVPLVVPITLVNHHAARFDLTYVRDQVHLRPHSKELCCAITCERSMGPAGVGSAVRRYPRHAGHAHVSREARRV